MANFTRSDLKTNNANLLPDNINESITPQDLRDAIDNNADSNVNRITDPYFKFLGTTGGTSTAYTLTNANEYPGDAYTNETYFILQFNANNGLNPTLNVNGIGAKDLYLDAATQVTFADTITANERYAAVYDSTLDAFLLVGIFNPNAGSVPAGSNGDIQYNNNGAFGGTSDISIDANSDTVISGDLAIGGTTPENDNNFNSITLTNRNRISSSVSGYYTQLGQNVDAAGNLIETTGIEPSLIELGPGLSFYADDNTGTAGSAFQYTSTFFVQRTSFQVTKSDGTAGITYDRINGDFRLQNGNLEVDDIVDSAATGAPNFPNGLTASGQDITCDDLNADEIRNEAGTGAPDFPNSLTLGGNDVNITQDSDDVWNLSNNSEVFTINGEKVSVSAPDSTNTTVKNYTTGEEGVYIATIKSPVSGGQSATIIYHVSPNGTAYEIVKNNSGSYTLNIVSSNLSTFQASGSTQTVVVRITKML